MQIPRGLRPLVMTSKRRARDDKEGGDADPSRLGPLVMTKKAEMQIPRGLGPLVMTSKKAGS